MIERNYIAALALASLVSGCTTAPSDRFPSLEIRDVERAEGTFEPVAGPTLDVPTVEVEVDGTLEARLASLLEQASAAHAQFTRSLPNAETRVRAASGSAVGSDSWAAAQVALADLDSARSTAAIALGDLDILFAAASVQADDVSAITSTRDQVIALVSQEDAALERLRAQVR